MAREAEDRKAKDRDDRAARLGEALRENLRRRKAQARGRDAAGKPETGRPETNRPEGHPPEPVADPGDTRTT